MKDKYCRILYVILSYVLLVFFSCNNDSITEIEDEDIALTKDVSNEQMVHYIESIDDLHNLIAKICNDDSIGYYVTNEIAPKASVVNMTFNGYTGEPYLLRENIITNFSYQAAELIGVTAYTDYYLNFYKVYATVYQPNAIAYLIRDSPVCGIIPGHDEFGTDFGYSATTVKNHFGMQTTVLKVKNKVGSSVQLNKYYPRAPDNLIWNYAVYVP